MFFSTELVLPPNFSFERFDINNLILKILLSGKLDLYNYSELFILIKIIEEGGLKKFILDLSGLDYIDSTSIGVLIKNTKLVIMNKGEIVMVNVPDEILEVFNMIKLERLIKIFDTEDDALSYLRIK